MELSDLPEDTEEQIKEKANCYTASIVDLEMRRRGLQVQIEENNLEMNKLRVLQAILLQKLKEKIIARYSAKGG
jgi:hypothetical protein